MLNSAILGSGHHVPSKVVTNDDLAKLFPTSDEWIQQRSGIKERRFIEHDGIGPSDLALPASRMALEQAGKTERDIDALIFATLSPDFNFPGSGVLLQHKLGIPGVPALDVRNQCSGFLYSLSIADAWIRSGVYRHVLVVGSEVHSTGLEFSERGREVTVLFGDGAGAVLLGAVETSADRPRGVLTVVLHGDGSGAQELWVEAPASARMPRLTAQMMEEGRHYPRMNGKQVFRWATAKMPEHDGSHDPHRHQRGRARRPHPARQHGPLRRLWRGLHVGSGHRSILGPVRDGNNGFLPRRNCA